MSFRTRRFVLATGLGAACACAGLAAAFAQEPPKPGQKYVCPPCGCSSDGKDFDAPGACPSCGMDLMPKPPPSLTTPSE